MAVRLGLRSESGAAYGRSRFSHSLTVVASFGESSDREKGDQLEEVFFFLAGDAFLGLDPGIRFLGESTFVVLFQAVRVVLLTESAALPSIDFSGLRFDPWLENPGKGLFWAELVGLLLPNGLSLLKNPSSAAGAVNDSANNRAAAAAT